MAEPEILTLEDIQNSPTLRSFGVLPGDEIVGDEIIRKFSKDTDSVNIGERLSEEDITNSPTLQNLDAKPGDRIIDDELVRTQTDDTFTQFMYGFDKQNNFVGYLTDVLEANVPLGRYGLTDKGEFKHYSPDELYGEGFTDAGVDERREMILRKRERDLMQEYGPYFEPEDGAAQAAGEVIGGLADITTLFPVGSTVKAASAISAGLAGSYSAVEDLAQKGEIDPAKAALFTGAGATLGAGFAALTTGRVLKNANSFVDDMEDIITDHVEAGGTLTGITQDLLESPEFGKARIDAALELTGRKLKPKLGPSSTEQVLDDTIRNDSALGRRVSKGLDKYLGTLSTRIGNISQSILRRLRRFEFDVHTKTARSLDEVNPFLEDMSRLGLGLKREITKNLYNGNFAQAKNLMPTQMKKNFDVVEKKLNSMYDELSDAGFEFQKLEGYFPRRVKDYDGLLNSLGKERKTGLINMQDDYAKRIGKGSFRELDIEDKTEVANKYIRGYRLTADGKPTYTKSRTMPNLTTEQIEKFYLSPEESLSMYLRNAVNSVERYKFFGRNFTKNDKGAFDADVSIGKIIEEERAAGNLDISQEDELLDLVKSRFMGGEQSVTSIPGTVRDLGYLGTIANPISAITQFGDLGASGALHGFRNTVSAMFGKKDMSLVDVGITNMQQELAEGDIRPTAKLLNNLFTLSGFRAVDRLGKESLMNAAFKKNIDLLKTKRGEIAFKKKWKKFYKGETDSIINDFKNVKENGITDNLKFHAFNELSDVQPITMLEMPQAYLDSPNGRILYMLKSFMLKQYDVVRRNIVQEYKKGNKSTAIKNALALGGYLSAANVGTQTVKDMLLGRDVSVERIPTEAMWSLLGIYGINKYATERYIQQGQVTDFFYQSVVPATPIIDAVFKGGTELIESIYNDEDIDLSPVLKGIPMVGPIAYNWFGGGAEKYNDRLED